jgi:glycosyltransferase involved in cell wall biosynthesis
VRISVVIAAYNAAGLLEQTLASVAAQTLAPDEVIVVDDGSTDDTAKRAENFGARVISTPNRGVSAARNTGIASATGDWVALLDADDLWHPEKLARQAHALTLAPDVAAVACDLYQFRGDGEVTLPSLIASRRARYDALTPQLLQRDVGRLDGMGLRLMSIGMAFFPSTLLVRRDLALATGGFDEDMRRCEDYEFLLRVLARGDLLVVDAPLLGYRIHSTSLSNNAEGMNSGLISIAERLSRHPERYAPGAAQAFASRERLALIENAGFRIKQGDAGGARTLLARAGEIERDPRWWMMKLASLMPNGSIAALSALKRGVWRRS